MREPPSTTTVAGCSTVADGVALDQQPRRQQRDPRPARTDGPGGHEEGGDRGECPPAAEGRIGGFARRGLEEGEQRSERADGQDQPPRHGRLGRGQRDEDAQHGDEGDVRRADRRMVELEPRQAGGRRQEEAEGGHGGEHEAAAPGPVAVDRIGSPAGPLQDHARAVARTRFHPRRAAHLLHRPGDGPVQPETTRHPSRVEADAVVADLDADRRGRVGPHPDQDPRAPGVGVACDVRQRLADGGEQGPSNPLGHVLQRVQHHVDVEAAGPAGRR